MGQYSLALKAFNAALAIQPDSADTHCNLANAQAAQGLLDDAATSYRRALILKPNFAQAINGLGTVLRQLGEAEAALQAFDDAIACLPGYPEACYYRAATLHDLGRLAKALDGYDALLSAVPHLALGHWQRGCVLVAMRDLDAAIGAFAQALAADPHLADVHHDLGHTLLMLGRAREAEGYLRTATQLNPAHANAFLNLGVALHQLGDVAGAEAAYRKSLEIDPASALAYSNLGGVLHEVGRPDEAVAALEQALALTPDDMNMRISKLHQQAQMCDWRAYTEFAGLGQHLLNSSCSAHPWQVLAFDDDPVRNRQLSEIWTRARCSAPTSAARTPAAPAEPGQRIRIGYFSADFQAHATMHLISGLMKEHDRSRFEITAFSFGPDRDDPVRRQLIRDVEHFIDARDLSDQQIAMLAQTRGVDIAVDLKGHTLDARPGIFAHRAAPVQVSYLGYPGTTGAPFMDYVIGDGVVFTPENKAGFSESLIALAGSYQVNDSARAIAETVQPRAFFGIPEGGFVFACFNNTFKIGPAEFAIWMRLLRKVDGSVLWLLRTNNSAETNLRREAASLGIAPNRLIFAERQAVDQHLARHRHIDLFLDTFNYNAHTTASDALWAGVPIVTKAGKGFSARVAASLLTAAGLPELVTNSERDYEELALTLATDRPHLASLRAKLAANRLECDLFDTALFARRLETAYTTINARHMRGEPPIDIMMA